MPFTAGVIIGAGLSQKLVPALGAREVPLIGAALGALGLLLFLRLTPDSSYVTDLLPGIMLTSVGMGLVFVPITLIATSGVPVDDAGLASGLFNTAQPDRGRACVLRAAAVRGGAGGSARQRVPRHLARERDPPRRRRTAAHGAGPPP